MQLAGTLIVEKRTPQRRYAMSSCITRNIILSFFCLLLMSTLSVAGTTGKIAGKITEKETGEPLVGVNVIVKGTALGAVTDVEGFYTVLLVPPGVQSVVVSMVGHSTVTVNEVRVHIDETSPVDVQLAQEEIKMGSVTVIAEQNVVRKDVSGSVSCGTAARDSDTPGDNDYRCCGASSGC